MMAAVAAEATRLLERDSVLGDLRDALAEAAARRGRFVLVAGEAGVGKSAAIRAFCGEARGSARVLRGGCDALFTPRPLGPFLDIAEEAGGELGTAVNEGAPAVVAALLGLARPGSATIVVVEDVHWADEATLDVLRLLARKLGQAPLLVLATYRDDEVDRVASAPRPPWRAGDPSPRRATHGPIALAGGCRRARRLGGNRCKRAPPSDRRESVLRDGSARAGERRHSPDRADAVLARAARLSGEARAMLDAVAIVPPQADLWLLEAIAGESMEGLDACLGSGCSDPSERESPSAMSWPGLRSRRQLNRNESSSSTALRSARSPAARWPARRRPARTPRRGRRGRRRGASLCASRGRTR